MSENYNISKGVAYYAGTENTDISSDINNLFSLSDVKTVQLPSGTFYVNSTISIPTGKSLVMQGSNTARGGIATTILTTMHGTAFTHENTSTLFDLSESNEPYYRIDNNEYLIKYFSNVFSLGSASSITGGFVRFDSSNYNVSAFYIDAASENHRGTSIVGASVTGAANRTYKQVGLIINCDKETFLSTDSFGWLYNSTFDINMTTLSVAYWIYKQNQPTVHSWISEIHFKGQSNACTRAIFFDTLDDRKSGNGSEISLSIQSPYNTLSDGTTLPDCWQIETSMEHGQIRGTTWDIGETGCCSKALYLHQGSRDNIIEVYPKKYCLDCGFRNSFLTDVVKSDPTNTFNGAYITPKDNSLFENADILDYAIIFNHPDGTSTVINDYRDCPFGTKNYYITENSAVSAYNLQRLFGKKISATDITIDNGPIAYTSADRSMFAYSDSTYSSIDVVISFKMPVSLAYIGCNLDGCNAPKHITFEGITSPITNKCSISDNIVTLYEKELSESDLEAKNLSSFVCGTELTNGYFIVDNSIRSSENEVFYGIRYRFSGHCTSYKDTSGSPVLPSFVALGELIAKIITIPASCAPKQICNPYNMMITEQCAEKLLVDTPVFSYDYTVSNDNAQKLTSNSLFTLNNISFADNTNSQGIDLTILSQASTTSPSLIFNPPDTTSRYVCAIEWDTDIDWENDIVLPEAAVPIREIASEKIYITRVGHRISLSSNERRIIIGNVASNSTVPIPTGKHLTIKRLYIYKIKDGKNVDLAQARQTFHSIYKF